MERDVKGVRFMASKKISTHTLTWSVTWIFFLRIQLFCISTHTLTWSVTAVLGLKAVACGISTHTLTWSVTANM